MTATTEPRNTLRRATHRLHAVVNTGVTIYTGTLVPLLTATGAAVPAGTANAGPAVGVALDTVTGDGVKTIELERGFAWRFANSASTDEIKKGDIGATCYMVDNQTVAKTDNSAARKAAGKIIDVDAQGVWVLVG